MLHALSGRVRASAVAASMLLIASTESVAHAADPPSVAVTMAESAFQEAFKLSRAGHYAEACPKFLASYKLAPAFGALINLADCYENIGQSASAWTRFHEAIALAKRLGQQSREKMARDRAERIEPQLIRLTITSQEPIAPHVPHVTVKIDGNEIDHAVLGTAIPIDPGKHTVEATAAGKKKFVREIDASDATHFERAFAIEIPTLGDEQPTPQAPEAPQGNRSNKGVDWNSDASRTHHTVGYIAIATGIVGVGAGTFFGLQTMSTWSKAQQHCTNAGCDQGGVDLAQRAKTTGAISTGAFLAGGALLAGGFIVTFAAPKNHSAGVIDQVVQSRSRASERPRSRLELGVGLGTIFIAGTL